MAHSDRHITRGVANSDRYVRSPYKVPAIADPRLPSDLIILVIRHAELNELLVHVVSLLK